MPQESYPYAVGRVRAVEERLLDGSRWARLRELDEHDAVRYLAEAGYGANAAGSEPEDLIEAELLRAREFVEEVTPDKRLSDLFLLRVDAHNLKVLLKSRLLGAEGGALLLPGGGFEPAALAQTVESGDFSALPAAMQAPLAQAWELAEAKEGGSAPEISALCDRAVFAHAFSVLKGARGQSGAELRAYFVVQVDFLNVLSVVRARRLGYTEKELAPMLLNGGSHAAQELQAALAAEGRELAGLLAKGPAAEAIAAALEGAGGADATEVERRMDRELLRLARERKYESFSMGPIVGYLLAREAEAKALRVFFAARRAGVEPAAPDLYV